MSTSVNRRILFARWPDGAPVPEDFKTVNEPMPAVNAGQVLLRTLYLSLDPYMRGRMSQGPSYVEPMALGDTMCGQTVCRVLQSHDANFKAGDLALANTGWQDYAASDASQLTKLDSAMSRPSYALGVLGMPGFTAYVALLDIGQPKSGETVVVTAATGAVGSVVGQIAGMKGCRQALLNIRERLCVPFSKSVNSHSGARKKRSVATGVAQCLPRVTHCLRSEPFFGSRPRRPSFSAGSQSSPWAK